MGAALVVECLGLLQWCKSQKFGPLGVSGISMGGHMASLASTFSPYPLAVVPVMSSTSSSLVFVDGLLGDVVDWKSLQALLPEFLPIVREYYPQLDERIAARDLMRFLFQKHANLRDYPNPIQHSAKVTVVAQHDAYVDGVADGVHKIWPSTKVYSIKGGHISAYLLQQRQFTRAICDAYEQMAKFR
eukprot:m.259099 g.259099  ORF g.259099 m.259099 type:complete len:187 (+) comp54580_c0_seq2:933-1493(+)